MADQGSLSARDVHIQWSFALPGLQVCQFEGGKKRPGFRNLCCLLARFFSVRLAGCNFIWIMVRSLT